MSVAILALQLLAIQGIFFKHLLYNEMTNYIAFCLISSSRSMTNEDEDWEEDEDYFDYEF